MSENEDACNVYKFTFSPNSNSNICFSFSQISTGEIVSTIFFSLHRHWPTCNLDHRHKIWPHRHRSNPVDHPSSRRSTDLLITLLDYKTCRPTLFFSFVESTAHRFRGHRHTSQGHAAWCLTGLWRLVCQDTTGDPGGGGCLSGRLQPIRTFAFLTCILRPLTVHRMTMRSSWWAPPRYVCHPAYTDRHSNITTHTKEVRG